MEFLRCDVSCNKFSQLFHSVDEAIGFVEKNLDNLSFSGGLIIVRKLSEEMTFIFDSQESMLEILMSL